MTKKIKNRKKAPKFLQPFLWSYDINKIDIEKDKKLIIQQILDLGTEKEVKWLFETYSKREIKNILKNPAKGMWHKQSLNFWKNVLDVDISNNIYKKAILTLNF